LGAVKAIGLMSGTSLDGVDMALIETDGERIYSVYGISNPDKLGGIAAASGPLLL